MIVEEITQSESYRQHLVLEQFRKITETTADELTLWVNANRITIARDSITAEETLLQFLRLRLGLTSCKLGCGEGGCGACTVVLSAYNHVKDRVTHRAINACLTPVLSVNGQSITTAEGICSGKVLHPVQKVIADYHGSQCGFCTPGFVMSMYALWMERSAEHGLLSFSSDQIVAPLYEAEKSSVKAFESRLSEVDIEDALDGNLCRCTGYRPILEGLLRLTKPCGVMTHIGSKDIEEDSRGVRQVEKHAAKALQITRESLMLNASTRKRLVGESESTTPGANDSSVSASSTNKKVITGINSNDITNRSNEMISLQQSGLLAQSEELEKSHQWVVEHEKSLEPLFRYLRLHGSTKARFWKSYHRGLRTSWCQPSSLRDLLLFVTGCIVQNKRFKILNGNTERHIDRVYKRNHVISTARVKELAVIKWRDDGVEIGAACSIADINEEFNCRLIELQSSTTTTELSSQKNNFSFIGAIRVLNAYLNIIRWFAGRQVRNVACLGGNISTASPICDLNPLHIAANAILRICKLKLDDNDLCITYRQKNIADDFFLRYRVVDLSPEEIISSVFIPFPDDECTHIFGFKQCRRKEDDIAIVNSGCSVKFKMINNLAPPPGFNTSCSKLPSEWLQGNEESFKNSSNMMIEFSSSNTSSKYEIPIVSNITISYGGMAPITCKLNNLALYWKNKSWSFSNFIKSLFILKEETYLPPSTPGGMINFRMTLARNFFIKFFVQVTAEIGSRSSFLIDEMLVDMILSSNKLFGKNISNEICDQDYCSKILSYVFAIPKNISVNQELNQKLMNSIKQLFLNPPSHSTYKFNRTAPKGLDHFTIQHDDNIVFKDPSAVGHPNKHLAGDLHVTGKAIYVDDMPCEMNELHAFPLLSTEAHAILDSVDTSDCHKIPGYIDFVNFEDIKGINSIQDEELFASKKVCAVGQIIGLIIGTSHDVTREAAAVTNIKYSKLPSLVTLEDAIVSRSFFKCKDGSEKSYIMIHSVDRPTPDLKTVTPQFKKIAEVWKWLDVPEFMDGVEPDPTTIINHPSSPTKFDHSRSQTINDNDPNAPITSNLPIIKDIKIASSPSAIMTPCKKFLIVTGTVTMGGQEHFYLEPQGCRAIPSENDELLIISSTQDPGHTQSLVAAVTGLSKNRIVCKCKRMGGGFGGKETRASVYAAMLAVAAQKLQRPIRLILDRDTDFQSSGQRHTFMSFYRMAIEISTLKLFASDMLLYNDAGWSYDLSIPVMERAVSHCENTYLVPNQRAVGRCCKTNLPSNTAFRGFGAPQGMFVAESAIEHCAAALGIHPDKIRWCNLYRPGNITHYKYLILEDNLRVLWEKISRDCDYEKRKAQIEIFNRENIWKKRGIRIIPVKFGISFTKTFMNQAGSLVHIYTDGTILVSHTGTEMGQGLHTKVAQVAATVFSLPLDKIYIAETSTDKVPNGLATAASAGSDLNGLATLSACKILLERIQPYVDEATAEYLRLRESEGAAICKQLNDKERSEIFQKAAFRAHMDRVNLSANGFYATPNVGYNIRTNVGRPYHYLSYGVGCSEVELDVLTGDHKILRTDIIQDVGNSINPAIDIGQIEGAFVQGLGLFTIEEILNFPNGAMFTKGPGTYKIPALGDIPLDFRVATLENTGNAAKPALYSSKGVGEPPLFLASSVFFALRDSIEAKVLEQSKLRKKQIVREGATFNIESPYVEKLERIWRPVVSPLTSERICNACYLD